MNHMGNEFYFSGYQSGQAPWRFHEEDGLREYELKFRKELSGEFLLFLLERLVGTWRVLTCKSTFLFKQIAEEMMLSTEAMGAMGILAATNEVDFF